MEARVGRMKSGLGVIGGLLPLLYCGGLLFYFMDFSGSPQQAKQDGLGPTILGLAAVGLLFCIPLIFKLAKLFAGPRSPGSDGRDGSPPRGKGGFDPDAVVARYLAQQTAQAAPGPAQESTEPKNSEPRAGFGRKSR